MKRALWISLLATLAFAVILIVRLPALWVAGLLPEGVSCTQPGGTLWNGSCNALVVRGMPLGYAAWQLHPAALLRGKVSAYVDVKRGSDYLRGDLEASSADEVLARNLQAELPLDPALIPQLPPYLSGHASVNLPQVRIENGRVTAVEGQLEAHDLVNGSQRMALGSYALRFPKADAGKEPVGELTSLNGPLDVQGTLTLTREPGFVVEGRVAAGPDASPQLIQQLGYLGAPDGEGKRPFSLAGTF